MIIYMNYGWATVKKKAINNKSTLIISNKCIGDNYFSFKIKDLDTGKIYLVKPKEQLGDNK